MPELRLAAPADVPRLLEVYYRSAEDLETRQGRRPNPRNPAALGRLLDHLVGTDPGLALLVEENGEAVAFALAHERGGDWFLAFLFVLPEWQSRGLGRGLLEACLPRPGTRARLATCVEAAQPVPTALYARYGLVPRVPLYLLSGRLDGGRLPGLPQGMLAVPFDQVAGGWRGAVDELDGWLVGHVRPQDHGFWQGTGRRGWLFSRSGGTTERVVGYGYAQASGRLGPVATLEAGLLPAFLGHLVAVGGADAWQVLVPGSAASALVPLLAAGLRVDAQTAIYCATRSGPDPERYLPMSTALL